MLMPSLDGFLALLAALLLLGPSTAFSWLDISPTFHLPWVSEEPDSSRPFSLVQHGQGVAAVIEAVMEPAIETIINMLRKLSWKLS